MSKARPIVASKLLQRLLIVFLIATGTQSIARPAHALETAAPVAFVLCAPEGFNAQQRCDAFGQPPAYQVPSGRVLLIEQVSGVCSGDDLPGEPWHADIVASTQGVIVPHAILGIPGALTSGGSIALTLTRIYADPGSSVTIGLIGIPGSANRFCHLAFSGRLLKR